MQYTSNENQHPQMLSPKSALPVAACIALLPTCALAQELPSVDSNALLKEIQSLKDRQTTQIRLNREKVLQNVNAAISNSERAAQLWVESVQYVQFNGIGARENPAFKEWLEKDGEAINTPTTRNALKLYFTWLSLSLQKSAGAKVDSLQKEVLAYLKDLAADDLGVEGLDESAKKEKETPQAKKPGQPAPPPNPHKISDQTLKRVRDSILRKALKDSPVVQYWRIDTLLDSQNWAPQPGNLDAIYSQVLLPVYREKKDPRALDYWDFILRKETDAAAKSRLALDQDNFNLVRKPALLWSRAEELLTIGQKNRATNEMIAIIRAFPNHPNFKAWLNHVEVVINGGANPPAPTESAPE